jgi:hypothetical protein
MISGKEKDKGQDFVVSVYNEDNGLSEDLRAGRGTPVSTVIRRMYEKFRLERQPDDRVRCESTGEDVLTHAGMSLGEYLEAGHCPDLRWTFAGGTGGA